MMIELKWYNLLKQIVNMNSGTGNFSGADQVRSLLKEEFEKIGFMGRVQEVGQGHKVLVFDYPDSKPNLMLVGHLDTVFPAHSHFQELRVEGDHWIGPGVIDMKGGLILILHLLTSLQGEIDFRRVRIVINDDEEIGSPHSNALLKKLGAGVPYGLVFEPGLPDQSIVTSESGVLWLELKVKGAAAHAGLEHQKGVNAGMELVHKLTQLNKLTDYKKNVTFNLGTFLGGTAANVVCDHAAAKVDIRYVHSEDLKFIKAELDRINTETTVRSFETGQTPTSEILTLAEVPSFTTQSAEVLLPDLRRAAQETRQTISCKHVGYTSDANHLAQVGMSLLVGLGPCGGGMHTHHEFMNTKSYLERLELGRALVKSILSRVE